MIFTGDALEILKNKFEDNTIDTVITDPPYGLSKISSKELNKIIKEWVTGNDSFIPDKKGFMEERWDAFVPPPALWKEVYRVMKPGGTILVFAGSRTYDLMTLSLRFAGFELKDTLMWLNGEGMPKGTSISKEIDKKLGKEPKIIARNPNSMENCDTSNTLYKSGTVGKTAYITEPNSDEAKKWDGYQTHSLKPMYEPIIMLIKPNDGTYVNNALKWKVAGLNIDAARIETDEVISAEYEHPSGSGIYNWNKEKKEVKSEGRVNTKGRFPGNVIINEIVSKYLDKQQKGVSKYFYVSKTKKKERNFGDIENSHKTVKPLELMLYLVKLTSMPNPNQIYLDPFMGTGKTGMACEILNKKWHGIEINEEYVKIAVKQLRILEKEMNI